MSAWIRIINEEEASEELLSALKMCESPHGTVDNVMRVHSLRPNTMIGHLKLYHATLHDDENTVPMWLQETVASYVSLLNQCEYSLANHWKNASFLIDDPQKSVEIEEDMKNDWVNGSLDNPELAFMEYARKLTRSPGDMIPGDVEKLREVGWDDGQILEVNQIIGYFNYVNRSLNGLGVTTEGDVVGFYAGN